MLACVHGHEFGSSFLVLMVGIQLGKQTMNREKAKHQVGHLVN